jgi:hypothetical protein
MCCKCAPIGGLSYYATAVAWTRMLSGDTVVQLVGTSLWSDVILRSRSFELSKCCLCVLSPLCLGLPGCCIRCGRICCLHCSRVQQGCR